MPERKAWTPEQDQLLKHLRQQAKINKWSIIAKKMAEQYNMPGRTGKQCRERYHNHLDSKISRAEWTKQQEQNLYTLHDQIGNKWAIIAQKLAGRTDNCVKNHFYSRMRKAIRKLNKTMHQHNKKDYKEIKMQTLYKIVQATDEKFKNTINPDQQLSDRCCKIKNLLLNYSNDDNVQLDADIETLKQLYHNIHQFSLKYKCKQKRERRNSQQGDGLLQVPRFSHKGKTTSDRGSEEDQDQYSKAFSKSYDGQGDDDDEDMEQSYVSSRPKITSTPKIAQPKKQQTMIIPTPMIAPQPLKPPVLSIKVPAISSKFSLNMEQDPQKMESLLKHEGLLENSEMLNKNGQLGRGSTLRRDDSYGLMIDEQNKLHNSLLGDSVRLTDHHHVNLSSNLNFSVDLEEDNKLFR